MATASGDPAAGDTAVGSSAPSAPAAGDLDRRSTIVGLTLILALVSALRLVPMLAHDWPLGDGGLFYVMIGDIIAAGFALPDSISYQGGIIPFAYPPLAFYVAGVVETTTQLARSDVMRVTPTVTVLSCVAAMYLVAAEIGPSRRHALVSTAFFGALLGLTDLLSSGGGLTRSMGLLLALLATWQGIRMYHTGRWRNVAATALLAGLALLSHPQAGLFIAVGMGSVLLTRWSGRALLQTIVSALGAALVASPWIAAVVTRHGIEPFISAAGVPHRDLLDSALAYVFMFLFIAPVIGLLDIAGQVRQLAQRRLQLIIWRVGVFVLDPRFSPIAGAAPVSMLAAHGTLDLVTPLVWRLAGARRPDGLSHGRRISLRRAVVGILVLLAFVPTIGAALDSAGPDGALTPGQRTAMTWVRDHTSPETPVAILATNRWGSDDVSEWFPALSERNSVTTSQGLEWIGDERFDRYAIEDELRSCQADVAGQADCVDAWVERHYADGEIVLFVAGATGGTTSLDGLVRELLDSGGYRALTQGDAWTILAPDNLPLSESAAG